jgi:membrane-associated phospholipid phosphatase
MKPGLCDCLLFERCNPGRCTGSFYCLLLLILSNGVASGENWFKTAVTGPSSSPFQLSWAVDIPLFVSIISLRRLTLKIPSNVKSYTPEQIENDFSKNDVFFLDRPVVGPLNESADFVSQAANGIVWSLPFTYLLAARTRPDIVKLSVMFLQIQLMYPIVTQTINNYVARKRPFFYSNKMSMAKRQSHWAQISFVSGHANFGFAFATFFASTWSAYYPDSKWKSRVWTASMGLAATTAVARVLARQHFPSDVLAGASTGLFIGWLVPWLHKKRNKKTNLTLDVIGGRAAGLRLLTKI